MKLTLSLFSIFFTLFLWAQPGLTVNIVNSVNVECHGDSTGSASAQAVGGIQPYTYEWDDPNNTVGQIVNGLPAGTFVVTVTDDLGDTATDTVEITQPDAIVIELVSTDASGCGSCDGSITSTVTGGTQPYTYSWSNGETTEDITGLCAGEYILNITDAYQCEATDTSIVQATGSNLEASISSSSDVSCSGAGDGSATVSATGGSGNYTYQWDDANNQTTQTATGLSGGTYNVTVTDDVNCSVQVSITIEEPAPLALSSIDTNPTCNGECNGEIELEIVGGTTPYDIQWNDPNFQTTLIATGLCADEYSAVVTDANGCMDTLTTTLTEPASINVTITTTLADCGQNNGSATASATGGSGNFQYLWDDPNNQTTETASNLAAGSYNVLVTDDSGCSQEAIADVSNVNGPEVTIDSTDVTCNGNADGEASADATGGTQPYTYEWNDANTQTTATASNLPGGNYTVTVTDDAQCIGVASVTINEPDPLTIATNVTDESCTGCADGEIETSVFGGTPNYNYSWDDPNNQTTANATNLSEGIYTVTITDENNCQATATDTVYATANISELEQNSEIILYPNPTQGSFTVELPDMSSYNGEVMIVDVRGRIIYSSAIMSEELNLSIHNQPNGIYIVKIIYTIGDKEKMKHLKLLKR